MPKLLTRVDYMKRGKEKDLTLIAPITPKSFRERTDWKCDHCGQQLKKSLRAVQLANYGCTCQAPYTLKNDKYEALAENLGIEWLAQPGSYPTNNKDKTMWRGKNGQTVSASYHELYRTQRIPRRLRTALGLDG